MRGYLFIITAVNELEKIETDITYMQEKLADLNDIVTQLRQSVEKLEKQNLFLAGKVEELSAETIHTGKPPHY